MFIQHPTLHCTYVHFNNYNCIYISGFILKRCYAYFFFPSPSLFLFLFSSFISSFFFFLLYFFFFGNMITSLIFILSFITDDILLKKLWTNSNFWQWKNKIRIILKFSERVKKKKKVKIVEKVGMKTKSVSNNIQNWFKKIIFWSLVILIVIAFS